MSWAVGYDSNLERWVGYGVPAYCDHPDCNEEINRGLAYACGDDMYGGEHGCGMHFCPEHLHMQFDEEDPEWEDEPRECSLCERCAKLEGHFPVKPDHPEWVGHMLTDESWQPWRDENPDKVKEMEAQCHPISA